MSGLRSPILRIDLSDRILVDRLTTLMQLETKTYENGAAYRAPEVLMARRDTYSPGLIKALLETGEVELWEYQRNHPDYPRIGRGFAAACDFLRTTYGVKVIEPSAP